MLVSFKRAHSSPHDFIDEEEVGGYHSTESVDKETMNT